MPTRGAAEAVPHVTQQGQTDQAGLASGSTSTPAAVASQPSRKTLTPTLELLRLGTHGVNMIERKPEQQTHGDAPKKEKQVTAFLSNKRYPPGYYNESFPDKDCAVPPRAARLAENEAARRNGLETHGWNIEERYNAETGGTEFSANRLRSSVEVAKLPGTELSCPRLASKLYEVGERGKADASTPPEVANANVLVKITDNDGNNHLRSAPAGRFFKIQEIGEVHTYLMEGDEFKLAMPPPDADNNPVQDEHKTLVVFAHGRNMKQGTPGSVLKPADDVEIGQFGPPARKLSTELIPDTERQRLYATTRSRNGIPTVNRLAPEAKAAKTAKEITGTDEVGHRLNSQLAKMGRVTQSMRRHMPTGEAKTISGASGWRDNGDKRAIDFMVHRTSMHALTIRSGHTPTDADVLALRDKLAQHGLHYERVLLSHCFTDADVVAENNLDGVYTAENNPAADEVGKSALSDIQLVGEDGRFIPATEENIANAKPVPPLPVNQDGEVVDENGRVRPEFVPTRRPE